MGASLESPFFTKFLHLLILFIHLGCFLFPTSTPDHHRRRHKNSTTTTTSSNKDKENNKSGLKQKTHKALSSSFSFLHRIFASKRIHSSQSQTHTPPPPKSSPTPTPFSTIQPDSLVSDPPSNGSRPESDISADNLFFPLRNDIYPCPLCGEIFHKPNLLRHHQSINHAVSELRDSDSGKNIIRIIFNTGWPDHAKAPQISRVLKIHHSPNTRIRFEEYREIVKLKASLNDDVWRLDGRCVADGNELLRFHCATFLCDLGQNGNSSICNQQFCSVCGIIRGGFSPKLDGISTLSTGYRAHVSVPEDIEEEFKYMRVKRAILVCRVIAGRVGCDQEEPGFDSVAMMGGTKVHTRIDEEDELLVFDPTAVLPCFVIAYTV